MDSFTTKLQIGNLEGKENWATWKYKVSIMLRGTEGAMEAAEGKLRRPILSEVGGDAAISQYNLEMGKFRKAESSALLTLTINMSEDTLKKIMRFETAYEVWQELHRLFQIKSNDLFICNGQTQDRAYNLCMEFFSFKHNKEDDVSTHMAFFLVAVAEPSCPLTKVTVPIVGRPLIPKFLTQKRSDSKRA